MSFSQGFAQGFGLMDAYYARKEEREYLKERRQMEKETHGLNVDNAKRAGRNADYVYNKQVDQDFATQYASIVSNEDGSPIDLSKLTPEQMQQKKGQLTGFLNQFEPAKKFFTNNPNVDPENPLAGVDMIFDQKTKEPAMVFNLRMKDGSSGTLSERRSSDADDPYVVVPVSQVDAEIRGALGSMMGTKATPQEYRQTKAASEAANLKYQRDLGLENVKGQNQMRLEAFKQGYSFDGKGNPIAPGQGGALRGKKLDDEVKRMDTLLKTHYGQENMSGMFVLDGTGQQFSWAGILGRQMLEYGQAPNAHEAVARAMRIANDLKASGGEIIWDGQTGSFLLFDGTTGEDGKPNITPLGGRPAQGGGQGQEAAPDASAPSGKTSEDYYTFLKSKYPDRSDADIRERVKARFPEEKPATEQKGDPATPAPNKAPDPAAEKPADTSPSEAGLATAAANPDEKDEKGPDSKGLMDTVKEKVSDANTPKPRPENPSTAWKLLYGDAKDLRKGIKDLGLEYLGGTPKKYKDMSDDELKSLLAKGGPGEFHQAAREVARRKLAEGKKEPPEA